MEHVKPPTEMLSNKPLDGSQTTLNRTTEAKKYARLLLGCYRVGDANDPEVYISAVVTVLSRYPIEIMRMACAPNDGLPSKLKWLPTVAEVSTECARLA